MSALAAIAARELRHRWTLLPAALVLGCAPVAMPALGFKVPPGGAESVGLILSLLFGIMTALICGWSVIGGELASRRLAFFFSRPTPWWAIWGGKMLASVLLTAAGGLLAAVPSLAAGGNDHLALALSSASLNAIAPLVLIVLAVSLAHLGSVAYSSRSYWLAVDVSLFLVWLGMIRAWSFPAFVGAMAILGERFQYGSGHQSFFALALLAAGAVGLWAGRTDARRVHAVQSLSLWGLLFAGIAIPAGLGWAIIQARPTDLRTVRLAAASPRGDWTWLAGEVRHSSYDASFLYRPEDGRFLRLGGGFTETPVFSADGRQAAWLGVESWDAGGWSTARLSLADLTAPGPAAQPVPLAVPPLPQGILSLAFCPDAACLLLDQRGALTLYALPSGRHLWTANAAGGAWLAPIVFLGSDRLRAYEQHDGPQGSSTLGIVTIRLADGSREVTGRIDTPEPVSPRANSSGDRLLAFQAANRAVVSLHDGASGELVAVLTRDVWKADADFLSDGRIALVESGGKDATLRVLRADGSVERRVDLGAARSARLGGEPEPGWLTVGLAGPPFTPGNVAVVDLTTGSVRLEKELSLAESYWLMGPLRPSPGLAASLFVGENGALVRLDAKAGTRRVLLGGP